jgi:TRAP transporter TAXI family solute receptor
VRRRAAFALAFVALAAAPLGCSLNDPPGGEGRLSIATGGSGGVYQVYGGALAEQMTEVLPDGATTAETTSASVDNLLLVANGDSDVAFSLGDSAIDAVLGRDAFAGRRLPIRALAKLYDNVTQVVVPADSDVRRIEDLRGRSVSVGSPNSGTEVIALRLLRVAGLDPEADLNASGLGVGESVAALRDGTIDGFFWSGGVPTGAITDLATTDAVRVLPLDAYLPRMRERYGQAYGEAEVAKGDYEGVAPARTIGVPNLLVVSAEMDDELAYRITRLLFARKAQLAKVTPQAEKLDPGDSAKSVPPVELHPGARRFYAEAAR